MQQRASRFFKKNKSNYAGTNHGNGDNHNGDPNGNRIGFGFFRLFFIKLIKLDFSFAILRSIAALTEGIIDAVNSTAYGIKDCVKDRAAKPDNICKYLLPIKILQCFAKLSPKVIPFNCAYRVR